MQRFAVLMTCYNRVSSTLECLRLLFLQGLPSDWGMDVFLVDDASPDGTGAAVREHYPEVTVIHGDGNLFWCRGMRLAWCNALEHGGYSAYLWLNDDMLLYPGALSGIIRDAEQTGGGAIIVAAANDDLGISYSAVDARGCLCSPGGAPEVIPMALFNGNCVWVPSSVSGKIGILSGELHHAYGDFDYARRASRNGVQCYLASSVAGFCKRHPSPYSGARFPMRLRSLMDPKGRNLHDVFLYRYRNAGLLRAICSAIHVILLVILGRS